MKRVDSRIFGIHCFRHKSFVWGAVELEIKKEKVKMKNYHRLWRDPALNKMIKWRDNSKFKIFILIVIFVFGFFMVAQGVIADNYGNYGLDSTVGGDAATALDKANVDKGGYLSGKIGKIVGAGLAFVGVLFFILMIYGGILWMTARGNDQQVTKAKELIIAAVIGLVIVLSAYAITAYIGGAITAPSTP